MRRIVLHEPRDSPVRRGHPWIFSRASREGLDGAEPGEPGPFGEDKEVRSLLQGISSKKQELAQLKEDFQRSWSEESKELKTRL